jgi:hypothetical protein
VPRRPRAIVRNYIPYIYSIIYHVGPVRGTDFQRLKAARQGCNTLRKAQVHCSTYREDTAKLLSAFAHDNLREFQLIVDVTNYEPIIPRSDCDGLGLIPSFVMPNLRGLPSGTLACFPKLEFLQIVFSHSVFPHSIFTVRDRGDTDGGNLGAAIASSTFLISERHPALKGFEIGFWGGYDECEGAIRFIACGSDWDVNTAGWERSAFPHLDDMF